MRFSKAASSRKPAESAHDTPSRELSQYSSTQSGLSQYDGLPGSQPGHKQVRCADSMEMEKEPGNITCEGFAILRATGEQASGCRGGAVGGRSGSPIDTTSHLGPPISSQRQETSSHLPLRTGLARSYVSISLTRQQDPDRNQLEPQDKQGRPTQQPRPYPAFSSKWKPAEKPYPMLLPHRCLQKLQPQTPFLNLHTCSQSRVGSLKINQPQMMACLSPPYPGEMVN